MAKLRSKPDFTAGVVILDGSRHIRAIELQVKSDNLYALQPRRGKAQKFSYHQSGESHFKIGNSARILPIIDLPPRILKERAFLLDGRRRRLFAVSLDNMPLLLDYTGQQYDRKIEIRLPEVDGLFTIELFLGNRSGLAWIYQCADCTEATISEYSFSGAEYEFCVRLGLLSATPVYRRTIDDEIVGAWREAAADLGIRIVAPFPLTTSGGDSLLYEAFLPDFGGLKGLIIGSLARRDGNIRTMQGYYSSDLSSRYRKYDRTLFIEALNDWRWFGEQAAKPPWYT